MRAVRREIDTISAHLNATSIDVGPMPTDEMSELVRAMVRLTPELRDSVVNAAAGRPVHAIQLIGHLVEKSGLAAASNGYELAPDATLPATIEDLWMLRVDEALSSTDSPIAAKQAITLAALLGMRIERRVWVQICKRTGVGAAEQVLENFATSGLIERVPGGSRLRHDLLRFALENTARSGGEWAMYQWMCADIIEVVENPSAERELRRAHHLVDGGFYDEALGILVEDLSHTVIDTRISLSRDAAELAERALDELTGGNPKSDSRWGQVRAQRLIADRVFHDMKKEAAAPLLELLEWANEHDDQATLADAHQMRAERLIRLGEPLEAVAEIEAYGKAAERLGDPRRLARAYNMLALVWNEGHDHERALAYAERGVEILRGLGGSIRLGWSLLTLANIANQLSLFERAEELVSESAKLFREHGVLGGEASAQVVLAQICRKSGRLLQAKAAAERGIDIASQMGSTRYPMATIVLHAILVERGDHDAATDLFDQRIDEIDEGGHMHYAAFMRASALISFATRGDMDRFDQAFEASWAFWEGGSFDSELPGIFERAAEILAERGEVERAERVQQALDHYRRMVDENLAQWRRYG
jgi:tetratricopeptide (TPR) repeat protein